jgi:hypothetical protein
MVDLRISPASRISRKSMSLKAGLPVSALAFAFLAGCMDMTAPGQNGDAASELSLSPLTTSEMQAENATISGAKVMTSNTGFHGTGYVDFQNASNDFVDWNLGSVSSGSYTVTFRYANGGSSDRPLKITDGTGAILKSSFSFPPTGSWSTWKTISFTQSFSSATHHIRITAMGLSGGNFDYLQVQPATSSTVPTASQLLAKTSSCSEITNGRYKTDDDASSATVAICKLNGAVYWKADMDIDCDGVSTSTCNSTTDPWYQNQTSFTTSTGNWLNSATLPYYVVPLPSSRFDYTKNGIHAGQVAAIIFNGKVIYAVFGDEGPSNIIGEASVATANLLGIPSNPANGGSDGPVTYIVFTGSSGVVSPIEDHNKATSMGQNLASTLLKNN